MTLRSRRKSISDLIGGKHWTVEQQSSRECIWKGEMIKYTQKDWRRKLFCQLGQKSNSSIIFIFAELINSELNEWLEPESVRVNEVAVLSIPRLIDIKILRVGDTETKL